MFPLAENSANTPTTLLGILGILATGISALLGMVVKWLLSHITDLTKQVTEMSVLRDKVMADSQLARDNSINELQKGFKDSLVRVIEHCDKEIERQVIHQRDCNTRWENIMTRHAEAVEELKDAVAALHARILAGQ